MDPIPDLVHQGGGRRVGVAINKTIKSGPLVPDDESECSFMCFYMCMLPPALV